VGLTYNVFGGTLNPTLLLLYLVTCCIAKTIFFTCALLGEFCYLGDVAKITGRKYLKSHAILVYYLV